jgi:hypothetical protein
VDTDDDGDEVLEEWPHTMLWRVPMLLDFVGELSTTGVAVDPCFLVNIRTLARAGRTEEVQRARFLTLGEWPIILTASGPLTVMAPRAVPRFQGEAARVVMTLLRRAAEMSDPSPTLVTSSTEGTA